MYIYIYIKGFKTHVTKTHGYLFGYLHLFLTKMLLLFPDISLKQKIRILKIQVLQLTRLKPMQFAISSGQRVFTSFFHEHLRDDVSSGRARMTSYPASPESKPPHLDSNIQFYPVPHKSSTDQVTLTVSTRRTCLRPTPAIPSECAAHLQP